MSSVFVPLSETAVFILCGLMFFVFGCSDASSPDLTIIPMVNTTEVFRLIWYVIWVFSNANCAPSFHLLLHVKL